MKRLILLLLLCVGSTAHAERVDYMTVVTAITTEGDEAVAVYRPENGMESADAFSSLYFDRFEESGMEAAVGAEDPGLKGELEHHFSQLIGLASQGAEEARVAAAWQTLRARLIATAQAQVDTETTAWGAFVQSFLILVREGFEAILVITALTTYLRRSGAPERLGVIYHGVGWALAASVATAVALGMMVENAGTAREGLEGATMLLAAGVLFYVSYWLISKSEAGRWQRYVQGQIDRALSRGSLFALGFAAFLAVYREGAETVLFYQALMVSQGSHPLALAGGFAAGAIALGGLYLVLRSASLRLPMGLFFTVTAALLYYLAVLFTGNGVLELQEARWLAITPIDGLPSIAWIGFHPTVEGSIAQGGLALLLVIALFHFMRQTRRQEATQ